MSDNGELKPAIDDLVAALSLLASGLAEIAEFAAKNAQTILALGAAYAAFKAATIGIALGNPFKLRAGMPESLDYDGLGLPTLADCPDMRIEFMPSEAPPADPGELGAVVAPPAIANALFSATGLRPRRLPLLSDGI
jgi:hypothetical protein